MHENENWMFKGLFTRPFVNPKVQLLKHFLFVIRFAFFEVIASESEAHKSTCEDVRNTSSLLCLNYLFFLRCIVTPLLNARSTHNIELTARKCINETKKCSEHYLDENFRIFIWEVAVVPELQIIPTNPERNEVGE